MFSLKLHYGVLPFDHGDSAAVNFPFILNISAILVNKLLLNSPPLSEIIILGAPKLITKTQQLVLNFYILHKFVSITTNKFNSSSSLILDSLTNFRNFRTLACPNWQCNF